MRARSRRLLPGSPSWPSPWWRSAARLCSRLPSPPPPPSPRPRCPRRCRMADRSRRGAYAARPSHAPQWPARPRAACLYPCTASARSNPPLSRASQEPPTPVFSVARRPALRGEPGCCRAPACGGGRPNPELRVVPAGLCGRAALSPSYAAAEPALRFEQPIKCLRRPAGPHVGIQRPRDRTRALATRRRCDPRGATRRRDARARD